MDIKNLFYFTGTLFFSVGVVGAAIIISLSVGSQIFRAID